MDTSTLERPLTVAVQASQLGQQEFSPWLRQRYEAVGNILESVEKQVTQGIIEPIVGARIASCVSGGVFGYEEFHPRGDAASAEQMLDVLKASTRHLEDR